MNKEKPKNRKASALETRKKIYETADLLFKKHGYANVSVDSIVELAGVAKGTFYVHFDSKITLMAALMADFVNKLDLDYKSFLQSFPPGTMASDMLISLAGKIADIISSTVGYELMKIIYEAQLTKTINTEALLSYNREIYQIFSSLISQGVQQGEFKTELTIQTIANHCIMSIRGITYEWCIRYPDFDLKEQVLKHFELLLTGIKKAPAS